MVTVPIALQLYTVRDETAKDFVGTLEKVASIGYSAVEFAGYGGLSAEALAAQLNKLNLTTASTHVGRDALIADVKQQISYCKALNCKHLVLPWLAPEYRDPAGLGALASFLNDVGRQCNDAGIAFSYHNHDFEFAKQDGAYLLDLLLDSTDPAFVGLEFDVYWAAYAGVDPLEYLRARADRIHLVHMKDMGPSREFTEVGDGGLDLGRIAEQAELTGVDWLIVENDQPVVGSIESARRSLENMRRLGWGAVSTAK